MYSEPEFRNMKRYLLLLAIALFGIKAFAQTSYRNEWIDYSKTYYKFKLHLGTGTDGYPIKSGLVRINQPALAAAGLANVPAENLQLWKDGQEVPLFTSVSTGIMATTDYVEFWGEINNGKLDKDLYRDPEYQLSDDWSLQTDTAAYFLTVNPGGTNKRFQTTVNNVAANTLDPTMYFMKTLRVAHRSNGKGFAVVQSGFSLYSSSYDKGEGYVSGPIRPAGSSCNDGDGTLLYTLNNLKPYLSGPSVLTLRVNAAGYADNTRTVRVKLNGNTASLFQMDYRYDAKVEEYLPLSNISSGTAALEFVNQSSVNCDEFRVSKTELVYPRSLDANNDTKFEVNLPANFDGNYLKFYNFNYGTQAPVLYDITNGKRYVGDITTPDTIRFAIEPSFVARTLVLTRSEAAYAKAITGLQQRNFVDYSNSNNQGDYLIISNPLVYGTGSNNYVEQYRQYRSSSKGGSYNAKVVDINELTDQFAYGVKKHPLSIKNFLRYARNNFTVTPKNIFLIGKGVNYHDYNENESNAKAEQLNLVPTWGYPASDNMLSSESASTATPLIPIGRLSAVSAQEVGDYLQKVKQYDSIQASPQYTITDKAWMKNVMHVAGANDNNIGDDLVAYMTKYRKIIQDTLYGAKVNNYSKIESPATYSEDLKDFRNRYEQGASLVTYFGHSSSTSLDFGLDNPNGYNNALRYPIFIVNGCDAGDLFTFDAQRQSIRTTISEKFVLEAQKGAIGYLSTTSYGVLNYLDTFTTNFYKSIGVRKYGKSIGEIIEDGISNTLSQLNPMDYYARILAEQYTFHGDPALRLNAFEKPDFIIESSDIQTTTSFISIADDSFAVKVRVNNIGKTSKDSIDLVVKRQFPGGSTVQVFSKKIGNLNTADSVTFSLPIVAARDKGTTIITATIDAGLVVDEMSETNNTASINVQISDEDIRPVYPYQYAIINDVNFKLSASTANALTAAKAYVMEIDTTALFNSPLKYTQAKTQSGGLVEFDKGLTLQDGTTYYWRVAEQTATPRWNNASFTYRNSPKIGFGQQHFFQHTKSSFDRLLLDSTSRRWRFDDRNNNLFLLHGIYPTSGTEDGHFSVQVNGSRIIYSACLGQSIILNVFDTLSFKPWKLASTPNNFNAEPVCDVGREYNFEYNYVNKTGRDRMRNFINSIPNGTYVAARLVYDWDNIYAVNMAADTLPTQNGNGTTQSLYKLLKSQGLPIDSFNRARTFGFVFKKNDTVNFKPKFMFTQGVYDRVVLDANCSTHDTLGFAESPKFGPAKAWYTVKWSGTGSTKDTTRVFVVGVRNNGKEDTLYTLGKLQQDFNISSVSAVTYPYIKLKMRTQDSITATPYQLSKWSVEYDGVPEGAIAPNLYLNMTDTVGGTWGDTLKVGVAFKNISKVDFDSLKTRLIIIDPLGNADTVSLPKTKKLLAGDTVHIDFKRDVKTYMVGSYTIYLTVNPDAAQPEQYFYNNFLYKTVYITAPVTPVKLLSFTARPVNNQVLTQWQVADEQNLKQYEVEHSADNLSFKKVGTVTAANKTAYDFRHTEPVNGKNFYRLRMVDNDGSFTYSVVRLVNFEKGVLVNVYPNPVSDKLNVVINRQDNKPATIRLINNLGQQLLSKTFSGSTEVDMKLLPAGMYVLQVNDGTETKTIKISKQ